MRWVDIHTHNKIIDNEIIQVRNVSLAEFENQSGEENVFFSLGIHPWEVENASAETLERLEKKSSDNHVKIIGECGLDKNIEVDLERQLYFFRKQIEISERLRKPLIIHCVGYFNELFQLKKEINPEQKWIIHGFRGKPELALQALKVDFGLSFGEKNNAESVKVTPLENLYIETDESEKSIKEIYKFVAEIKQCHVTDLTAGFSLLYK